MADLDIPDLAFVPQAQTVSLGELLSFSADGNPQLAAAFNAIQASNAGIDGQTVLPFSGQNTGIGYVTQIAEEPSMWPWLLGIGVFWLMSEYGK